MNHFLDIAALPTEQIEMLLQKAFAFKNKQYHIAHPECTVATLFYENSTRTRISFEMAANHLAMPVVHLNPETSSQTKGEVIEDTLSTLSAMGIQYFIIRHSENYLPATLAETIAADCHIINAGDGQHAHPSQALLDLMTIVEQKPNLAQLRIGIVGNIRHSRVANSLQMLFKKMGIAELRFIAPGIWLPEAPHFGTCYEDMNDAMQDLDVIICLRVQRERLASHEELDMRSYQQNFMLTPERLAFAKKDAMIMHPGPVNRNIEIESSLIHHPQSFILQQVSNGVYARMAILDSLTQENR